MKSEKIRIYLSEAEWQIVIHSLNDFRNKLIREKGYCPDVVNEVLAKVMNARKKRIKAA
ncbi:MAG: hypothetical protein AAGU32_07150 [Bacillota bacterium]